jgi:hypothetical protein
MDFSNQMLLNNAFCFSKREFNDFIQQSYNRKMNFEQAMFVAVISTCAFLFSMLLLLSGWNRETLLIEKLRELKKQVEFAEVNNAVVEENSEDDDSSTSGSEDNDDNDSNSTGTTEETLEIPAESRTSLGATLDYMRIIAFPQDEVTGVVCGYDDDLPPLVRLTDEELLVKLTAEPIEQIVTSENLEDVD